MGSKKFSQIENPPEFVINPNDERASRSNRKFNLYRMAIALNDVAASVYSCDAFFEAMRSGSGQLPHHVEQAFLSSIITCYARPFVHSRKSSLALPPAWEKIFPTLDMKRTHDRMLDLRHEVYAHTDEKGSPMEIIPAGYFEKALGRKVPRTSWSIKQMAANTYAISDFRQVAAFMARKLEAAVSKEIEALYGGMDLPMVPFPLRFRDDDNGL